LLVFVAWFFYVFVFHFSILWYVLRISLSIYCTYTYICIIIIRLIRNNVMWTFNHR
jgi:hypothetical protein